MNVQILTKNCFNLYSSCGYGNPISFKNVNENDVSYIELFLQEQGLKYASQNSNDGHLLNKADIFGEFYAENPDKFQFMPGDRILIREIVDHVKRLVDCDGPLTGLKLFRPTKNKKKKIVHPSSNIIPNDEIYGSGSGTQETSQSDKKEIERLKNELLQKVSDLFKTYDVNIDDWAIEMVDVDTSGTIGFINCVLCIGENGEMPEPKRVFYNHSKTRSGYWVLSNFLKHLRKIHPSIANKCKPRIRKTNQQKSKKLMKKDELKLKCETIESDCDLKEIKPNTQSVISVHDDSSEYDLKLEVDESIANSFNFSVEYVSPMNSTNQPELWLFDQITVQIQKMMYSNLQNGDTEDRMNFTIKNMKKYLTVVKTYADGNCLFSAIAHQLTPNPIKNKKHIANTAKLRSDVVKHILEPENFSNYQVAVQYEMQQHDNFDDVIDSTAKCKLWVQNVLSRSGRWGGLETIQAVSNMYRVNVVIFNENGACNMVKASNDEFDRTILLAYRLGANDVHNHYDSVTDMDSDTMYTTADFIINK